MSPAPELLQPLVKKVKFRLMVPTVLERNSYPDTLPGDKPVRRYYIDKHHKAVRLVFRTGAGEFWGIQETDFEGRARPRRQELPARSRRPRIRSLLQRLEAAHGRAPAGKSSYWVVNTLLDSLSNETMLAIAKGLKPLIQPGRFVRRR